MKDYKIKVDLKEFKLNDQGKKNFFEQLEFFSSYMLLYLNPFFYGFFGLLILDVLL